MTNMSSDYRISARAWILIVGIAIALHLFIFLGLKPGYLTVFLKPLQEVDGPAEPGRPLPNAIVAVKVDLESDQPRLIEIEPSPPLTPSSASPEGDQQSEFESSGDDLGDLVAQHQSPLPSSGPVVSEVVPPRPVEMTWPETKNLRHCLGTYVDVRIRVGMNGEILEVEPLGAGVPPDCARAAANAARCIVFLPGRLEGKSATMWTEVRIEFHKQ
jgi:hypothetical protein